MLNLVTGTGRCGTKYIARKLSACGLSCGHEQVFRLGGKERAKKVLAKNEVVAESSWLAVPFLGDPILEGAKIAHLVRHPRHTIESIARMRFSGLDPFLPYSEFAHKYLPELNVYDGRVEKSALMYLRWNERIEQHAGARFRVEDQADELVEWFGLDSSNKVNRRTNQQQNLEVIDTSFLDEDNGLTDELRKMAEKYGYDYDKPPIKPRRVYWALLVERSIDYHNVNAMLDVAATCGLNGYTRLGVPYTATDNARNILAMNFQEISANPDDTLVMLDADHIHPARTVAQLSFHDLGVVSALAFRRSAPHDPLFYVRRSDGVLGIPADIRERAIYQCAAAATCAIAIRRWVFDELQAQGLGPPYFKYEYIDGSYRHKTEDIYFGKVCEEAGIPHHCDTGIITPHIATTTVDLKTWQKHVSEHPELIREERYG